MPQAKHEEGQVQPTPTQEELDRAMMGEHVIDKEHDGSEIQNPLPPDPPPEPPAAAEGKKKQVEAKPSTGGYQTRQMRPQATEQSTELPEHE